MLAPALLLAALSLPSTASAAWPDCVHISTTSTNYRQDLGEVRDCQDRTRLKLIEESNAAGKPLSNEALDRLDDHHRAEVRKFLANTGDIQESEDPGSAGESGGDAPRPKVLRRQEGEKDLTAKEATAVLGLRKRLKEKAGAGGQGVTAEMGADIADTLKEQQGGVSEDMGALLQATSQSGGQVSPEVLAKLKAAAKQSRGKGLDLNLDPETEKAAGDADAAVERMLTVPTIDKR